MPRPPQVFWQSVQNVTLCRTQLIYKTWNKWIKGTNLFPKNLWPFITFDRSSFDEMTLCHLSHVPPKKIIIKNFFFLEIYVLNSNGNACGRRRPKSLDLGLKCSKPINSARSHLRLPSSNVDKIRINDEATTTLTVNNHLRAGVDGGRGRWYKTWPILGKFLKNLFIKVQ